MPDSSQNPLVGASHLNNGLFADYYLNEIVYDAFDLSPEERQLIEETTKYPYGEV